MLWENLAISLRAHQARKTAYGYNSTAARWRIGPTPWCEDGRGTGAVDGISDSDGGDGGIGGSEADVAELENILGQRLTGASASRMAQALRHSTSMLSLKGIGENYSPNAPAFEDAGNNKTTGTHQVDIVKLCEPSQMELVLDWRVTAAVEAGFYDDKNADAKLLEVHVMPSMATNASGTVGAGRRGIKLTCASRVGSHAWKWAYGFLLPHSVQRSNLYGFEFAPVEPGGIGRDFCFIERRVYIAKLSHVLIAGKEAIIFQPMRRKFIKSGGKVESSDKNSKNKADSGMPSRSHGCNIFVRFNGNIPPFEPASRAVHESLQQAAELHAKLRNMSSTEGAVRPSMEQPMSELHRYLPPRRLHLRHAISVAQRYGGNYYHCVIEVIPRLLLVLDAIGLLNNPAISSEFRPFTNAPIIVPGEPEARLFIDQFLRALGFWRFESGDSSADFDTGGDLPNQILYHDHVAGRGILVDQLLTSEWWPRDKDETNTAASDSASLDICQYYGSELSAETYSTHRSTGRHCNPPYVGRPGTETQPPRHALRLMRHTMLDIAGLSPATNSVLGDSRVLRIVYASRSGEGIAARRVSMNEGALLRALSRALETKLADDQRTADSDDFKRDADRSTLRAAFGGGTEIRVFRGSATPVLEQVRIFGEADIVVGVHGAALSNVVFSRSGAALVEVTMRRAFGYPVGFRDYAHLAAAMGLRYWAVPLNLVYSAQVELPVQLLVQTILCATYDVAGMAMNVHTCS
eukprot:g341.t1